MRGRLVPSTLIACHCGPCSLMTTMPSLEAASVLLAREGVTVVGVASNTAEALRQARALRLDVILVDIGLGDESGFDLAWLLARDRRGGQRVCAEVILISSYA